MGDRLWFHSVCAVAAWGHQMSNPLIAPPDWPNLGLHLSQWVVFKAAGYDMRQFYLIKPIPVAH
jgi:hypothetical protein